MDTFKIKTGDTDPIVRSLERQDGSAPDLTTATAVRFIMKTGVLAETAKVDAAAAIVDAATGTVKYEWADDDTDTPGDYKAEFEVHWTDDTTETFPAEGFYCVVVSRDLGGTS